ncbi:MAG: hypothetical protein DMG40_22395 [Acidobacteria bacterium]|nr:MAG: hypothetical protein DMG40_22395 [Acidobacteriota bacterium]
MLAPTRNKRRHVRYSAKGSFRGSELPALRGRKKGSELQGKVADISDGGFSIITARVPAGSSLLQGQLAFAKLPAQIPTLAQVRWTKRASSGRRHLIGLQYVL